MMRNDEKKESTRIKVFVFVGVIVILLVLFETSGPNPQERRLNQEVAEVARQNDSLMEHCGSVEDCQKVVVENNRRLAELAQHEPHDELFSQNALTAVYVGLGAIFLGVIICAVVRRRRQRTS